MCRIVTVFIIVPHHVKKPMKKFLKVNLPIFVSVSFPREAKVQSDQLDKEKQLHYNKMKAPLEMTLKEQKVKHCSKIIKLKESLIKPRQKNRLCNCVSSS